MATWAPIIGVVGSILAAFAGAGAATWFGFYRWRKQRQIERRERVAEQVLADFYNVRDVIEEARAPYSFGGEGESRPPIKGEEERFAGLRNSFFVPFERLQKHDELFSRLHAARYRIMALFGTDAEESFNDIWSIRRDILLAVRRLIEMADAPDVEMFKEDKAVIWKGFGEDAITPKVDSAIEKIEAICRPILKAE